MAQKIWKVRGYREKLTDEELVSFIKSGDLSPDDYVATNDMKVWVQIKDSIYQFYVGGKQDETL